LIRFGTVGRILGLFLVGLAGALLLPLIHAILTSDAALASLLWTCGVTAALGASLALLARPSLRELTQREALLLVVCVWWATSALGAIPFWLSPHYGSYTDAFFESTSGFTTTGATVLKEVEVLSPSLQLFRCYTHWIGGMGIVVLGIAILPLVGHGGMQLYRAEFSGARSERLRPRIAETALALWRVYLALTLAEYVALRLAGMHSLDAACHAFSTLGTGGFSTRTASVAAFNSPLIEGIIVVFMLLAGISFIQHYRLWIERRPRAFLADIEVRTYAFIVAVAVAIVAATLVVHSGYSLGHALRSTIFQVSSIVTTTGFVTDNYEVWHPLAQVVLLGLMYAGGCTGSTAGGFKISRVLLLAKVVNREFKRMVERRGVFAVRLGGRVIPEATVDSLLNLIYLALCLNGLAVLLLAGLGVDPFSAIAAVAASMFNIGPGLGTVGPLDNYAHLPGAAKWTLAVCMIAGRLEFYTLLVIGTPAFWRR
jgi:trk system potassium uptake protein TrkH